MTQHFASEAAHPRETYNKVLGSLHRMVRPVCASKMGAARHFGIATNVVTRMNHPASSHGVEFAAPDIVGSLNGRGGTFAMQLASSPLVVPARNNSCLTDRVQAFSGV